MMAANLFKYFNGHSLKIKCFIAQVIFWKTFFNNKRLFPLTLLFVKSNRLTFEVKAVNKPTLEFRISSSILQFLTIISYYLFELFAFTNWQRQLKLAFDNRVCEKSIILSLLKHYALPNNWLISNGSNFEETKLSFYTDFLNANISNKICKKSYRYSIFGYLYCGCRTSPLKSNSVQVWPLKKL